MASSDPLRLGESGQVEEALSTVDALAQTSFLVQELLARRAARHDVSFVQTRLLGILRDRRPTIKELASLLELDKSSVSGLVDRAERRGLVRRIPSQIDRRSVRVALTAEARIQIDAVAADFASDVEQLLKPLSPREQALLTGMLERVLLARAAAGGIDLGASRRERG